MAQGKEINFHIRVAFTKEHTPDWISKTIMRFLRKPYSHVLILFEDVDGKEKILHSVTKGTLIDEDKKYLETHTIVAQYKVPMRVSREIFAGYARGRVGRDYAESNFVNIVIEWMGFKWVPFKNGNSEMVCSSEIAAAGPLTALTLPEDVIWEEVRLELIDPLDVENFLIEHPQVIREI